MMKIYVIMILMGVLSTGVAHAEQCCSSCDKDKKTSDAQNEPKKHAEKEKA
ncbi:MAG: hypothetical protein K2X98_02045 [Alphaproteobacteria bacterium]|nr:hypothetical protein [Alphaproteobacteria bacterium]